jgi:hypothetical protein
MREDVKKVWVEALRSGRYQQGTGVLRNEQNEFCCLGVLCDLGEKKAWHRPHGEDWGYEDPYCQHMPPGSVYEGAFLTSAEGGTVAEMNDSGKTFAEIADWIEANL